ncbi:MAG: hypothetical protein ACHQFZ_10285 [Acidimicrobiales bacterium]
MNTLTIVVESVLGLIGVTIALGAPLTARYLQKGGVYHNAEPALVAPTRNIAGRRAPVGRGRRIA